MYIYCQLNFVLSLTNLKYYTVICFCINSRWFFVTGFRTQKSQLININDWLRLGRFKLFLLSLYLSLSFDGMGTYFFTGLTRQEKYGYLKNPDSLSFNLIGLKGVHNRLENVILSSTTSWSAVKFLGFNRESWW